MDPAPSKKQLTSSYLCSPPSYSSPSMLTAVDHAKIVVAQNLGDATIALQGHRPPWLLDRQWRRSSSPSATRRTRSRSSSRASSRGSNDDRGLQGAKGDHDRGVAQVSLSDAALTIAPSCQGRANAAASPSRQGRASLSPLQLRNPWHPYGHRMKEEPESPPHNCHRTVSPWWQGREGGCALDNRKARGYLLHYHGSSGSSLL